MNAVAVCPQQNNTQRTVAQIGLSLSKKNDDLEVLIITKTTSLNIMRQEHLQLTTIQFHLDRC